MNISRYLTESSIKLDMTTKVEPLEEGASETKWLQTVKEDVLAELVTLLEDGHRIGNQNKLHIDFVNRERKATTAIGNGIAIPHIRSLQAKEFMMAFARSQDGYPFGAPDDELTHLFFVMAAPPYEDALYLRVFKALMEILQYPELRDELMTVESPGEVIRIIRSNE